MKYQINKLRIIFSQEKYSIYICMKFVQQPTRLFCLLFAPEAMRGHYTLVTPAGHTEYKL